MIKHGTREPKEMTDYDWREVWKLADDLGMAK